MSIAAGFPAGCARDGVASSPPATPQTAEIATDAGLEASSWLTEADRPTLAAALDAYVFGQGSVSSGAEVSRVWSANGMRVFEVPTERLAEVERALRASARSASSNRLALLADGQWNEVWRAPGAASGQTVALEGERVQLGAGALRVLARCWVVPLPPEGSVAGAPAGAPMPGLRIEMVPQHAEIRAPVHDERAALSRPTTIDAASGGLVFERLLLGVTVRAGVAYVIVPERPGVDWSSADPPQASEAGTDQANTARVGRVERGRASPGAVDAKAPTATGAPAKVQGAGPRTMSAPTIGEALFMADAGSTRVVLVVQPRVPATFNLTGE